ncbi:MAG: tetratricopeptide repeat protein [Saprospiraceae bacterium]
MLKKIIYCLSVLVNKEDMQQHKTTNNISNRVGFQNRHRLLFTIFLIFLTSFQLFSQSTSEAVYRLSTEKQLDYLLENIYKIRTTNLDSGLHYANYAVELAQRLQDKKKEADAYRQRGVIYYYLGNFEEELASFQQALNIAESIDDKGLQGNILLELGAHFNRQKELRKAMNYQIKAEKLCRQVNDRLCVASALRNYGRLYLKLNEVDSAEVFLVQSYELKKEINDSVGLPYALNDLSEIAMLRNDFEASIDYLKQSSVIREAIKDSTGLAININNIGEVYLEQRNFVKAIEFFEKSLKVSRPLKFIDLQRHTLSQIGIASQALNDYKTAYQYLQESNVLNDSLYSVEKTKALTEMSTKYETEKKEQIIEKQKADLRIQRLIGFSVLSILLLIGLTIYYRIYQRRKYEHQIQQLQIQQKIQKERERISRDLHDNVGANLTKIITDLDLLSLQLEMNQTDKSSQRIENTRNFTQSTIRVLRDTIWAMNKDAFSVSEFADKTEAFLGYYLEDNMEWIVNRDIKIENQLTPTQVLNLLRIIQEATQNMLKYAKASRFIIDISNDENFVLSIKDNGIGFDENTISTDDNYGLYNMKKRAEDIGATIKIDAKIEKGVAIEVTI